MLESRSMKKVLKWIAIIFAVLVVIGLFASDKDSEDKNTAIERYNKQSAGVQACVKTLGEGVYSYKSLTWKLDNCNASK
jgi:hypothetical protein